MEQITPRRVRLGQQDRCFRVITGGKIAFDRETTPGIERPAVDEATRDAAFDVAFGVEPRRITVTQFSYTARRHKPLLTPNQLFCLANILGIMEGVLFVAFLVRAGVFQ